MRPGPLIRTGGVLVLAAGLAGCSSTQEPEVQRVATAFEDPSGDPEARCDLLAPATLAAFEKDQSASVHRRDRSSCPLDGGEVKSVEVWGGDAQVRMAGDTVFLTETSVGWRVTAAGCTPAGRGSVRLRGGGAMRGVRAIFCGLPGRDPASASPTSSRWG